jgi:hypothetical protein
VSRNQGNSTCRLAVVVAAVVQVQDVREAGGMEFRIASARRWRCDSQFT